MPNLKQAKKALRAAANKRVANDVWRVKLRAAFKSIRLASVANDKPAAEKAYVEAVSILDRAARRNIIHPNKAARRKSRLAKAIAKIAA